MRILIVSGEYPPMKGGVGRYTYNLVQALARKGGEVSVATSQAAATVMTGHGSYADSDRGNPSSGQDIDGNNNDCDDNNGRSRKEERSVATLVGVVRKGDPENSDRLLRLVDELEPDIVNIQYERGLYEIDTTVRHTALRMLHGSTLDRFFRACPVPVVSTLHTVFPYREYKEYVRERAFRKEGRFGFLPMPLRAAIRSQVMARRYDLLLQVVQLSAGIISPAKAVHDIVRKGVVIYHGAEPASAATAAVVDHAGHAPRSDSIDVASAAAAIKDRARREFGLPAGKKLLLAFGYVGSYKGFDILGELELPQGWALAVKQTTHERGTERPASVNEKATINLHLGYLDDVTMSRLFFACDAIILPYRVVSISGVMFDALTHGLPFVASDLEFFREFANMGLGITCSRDARSFGEALHTLDAEYGQYRRNVVQFGSRLCWDRIAEEHLDYYSKLISASTTAATATTATAARHVPAGTLHENTGQEM